MIRSAASPSVCLRLWPRPATARSPGPPPPAPPAATAWRRPGAGPLPLPPPSPPAAVLAPVPAVGSRPRGPRTAHCHKEGSGTTPAVRDLPALAPTPGTATCIEFSVTSAKGGLQRVRVALPNNEGCYYQLLGTVDPNITAFIIDSDESQGASTPISGRAEPPHSVIIDRCGNARYHGRREGEDQPSVLADGPLNHSSGAQPPPANRPGHRWRNSQEQGTRQPDLRCAALQLLLPSYVIVYLLSCGGHFGYGYNTKVGYYQQDAFCMRYYGIAQALIIIQS